MTNNMPLEEALDALGHWGTVTVRRVRFPTPASPGLVGKPVEWEVEVRIPGYSDKYGQPYVKERGPNLRNLVDDVYQKTEQFLFSDEGRAARNKYVDDRLRHNEHAAKVNPGNLSRHGTAPRQLGQPVPDVIGPDAPRIEDEKYDRR